MNEKLALALRGKRERRPVRGLRPRSDPPGKREAERALGASASALIGNWL